MTARGALEIDAERALAWRLARHSLAPAVATDAVEILSRVVALRGWPAAAPRTAVDVRTGPDEVRTGPEGVRTGPEGDRPATPDLDRRLAAGHLVRAYAFRGGSWILTPEDAATLLTVRTTTRVWESARYQRQGGFAIDDWAPLRDAVRERLADGPAARPAIAEHLAGHPALAHLADAAASGAGADALYKPLHWWGDICFGPEVDGRATFALWPTPATTGDARASDPRRDASGTWPADPWPTDPMRATPEEIDAAGRAAVRRYLSAYAPATSANLEYWLAEGLSAPRRRVASWLADLEGTVTVDVGGVEAHVLERDLDAMRAARPDATELVLPPHDPWVMGPGTADERVVPAHLRAHASRGAALRVRGGVVVGPAAP